MYDRVLAVAWPAHASAWTGELSRITSQGLIHSSVSLVELVSLTNSLNLMPSVQIFCMTAAEFCYLQAAAMLRLCG